MSKSVARFVGSPKNCTRTPIPTTQPLRKSSRRSLRHMTFSATPRSGDASTVAKSMPRASRATRSPAPAIHLADSRRAPAVSDRMKTPASVISSPTLFGGARGGRGFPGRPRQCAWARCSLHAGNRFSRSRARYPQARHPARRCGVGPDGPGRCRRWPGSCGSREKDSQGIGDGAAGDAHVEIRVRAHNEYQREGQSISCSKCRSGSTRPFLAPRSRFRPFPVRSI